MTNEPKPWRAEMPEAHAWMRGEVKCLAVDVQALVTKCNEELDKLRSELAEWKAKASPHCHDCPEYQRACEITGNYEELEAELAKVRGDRDSAVAAVKALGTEGDKLRFARDVVRVDLKEARARIAELEAAQQWRPMSEAPKEPAERRPGFCAWDDYLWLMPDGDTEKEPWCAYANRGEDEAVPIAWLPLPEPPKEGA